MSISSTIRMARGRVLAIGNNTIDHVFSLPTVPGADDKASADDYRAYPGGQGANAAAGMALLGLDVRFVGVFGDDAAAMASRRAFEALGVGLEHSVRVPGCNHHTAAIVVGRDDGQRMIVMHRDSRLSLEGVEIGDEALCGVRAVYADGHEPACSQRIAVRARALDIPVIIDLERVTEAGRALVSVADHLVAPADVILALADRGTSLVDAVREVRARGPSVVVATLGARGSVGFDGASLVTIDACEVDAVDTTGAGDAYHAGYVAALLADANLEQRMACASEVAGIACCEPGPRLTRSSLEVLRVGLGSMVTEHVG